MAAKQPKDPSAVQRSKGNEVLKTHPSEAQVQYASDWSVFHLCNPDRLSLVPEDTALDLAVVLPAHHADPAVNPAI